MSIDSGHILGNYMGIKYNLLYRTWADWPRRRRRRRKKNIVTDWLGD
jgi:hypothetical protein